METQDISSGEEAKYSVNLTKEEMDEILMRRKGKGDGKKDPKPEPPRRSRSERQNDRPASSL